MKNLLQNNDAYQTELNGCIAKHTAVLDTLSTEHRATVIEMFESLLARQRSHNEIITTKLVSYISQLDAQKKFYCENNLMIIEKVKTKYDCRSIQCTLTSFYFADKYIRMRSERIFQQ